MNRGSGSRQQRGRYPHTGFNEAPIHESGKFLQRDPDGSR